MRNGLHVLTPECGCVVTHLTQQLQAACERNAATEDPRFQICATNDTSERRPARDVPRIYQPGRRAFSKQRQRSKIADDNAVTGIEADSDSSAHNGDHIHNDSDISQMQRSAISCASLISSRPHHRVRLLLHHLLGVFFPSVVQPVREDALHLLMRQA